LLAGLCVSFPTSAAAQSVFTTELSEAGAVDVSFEFLGSIARRHAGGFEWYLPTVAVGVSDQFELGAAFSSQTPRSADEPRLVIPYGRWRPLAGDTRAVAVGVVYHTPVSNRDEARGYGLVDVSVSQVFGGATVTAGAYSLFGTGRAGDTRRGIALGWDQSISARWSYAIDWVSGDNWYGYLSTGVTYATDRQWITAGYCVGNSPAANHGPCLSAGRTF
jgi:hypothetical protein